MSIGKSWRSVAVKPGGVFQCSSHGNYRTHSRQRQRTWHPRARNAGLGSPELLMRSDGIDNVAPRGEAATKRDCQAGRCHSRESGNPRFRRWTLHRIAAFAAMTVSLTRGGVGKMLAKKQEFTTLHCGRPRRHLSARCRREDQFSICFLDTTPEIPIPFAANRLKSGYNSTAVAGWLI